MTLFADYWPSLTAFLLFGFLHSVGAQQGCKQWLQRRLGRSFVEHFWRLVYCIASYAFLYHVVGNLHWGMNPRSDFWVVEYPEWLWRILLLIHLSSIALVYVAFAQSDYLEFWGLRQAWHWLAARRAGRGTKELRVFGTHRLVTGGLYGWVRHPMLSGGLLFLLTSGPSRNNVVFLGMYLSYMLVGAWYEEKRLLRIFGDDYRRYRMRVGAFVPRFRPGRRGPGATVSGAG